MNRTTLSAVVLLGLGLAHSTGTALGAPTLFTIDSKLSSITLSVETQPGSPFTTPQFPGSDTASLSGTQLVDVAGGNIQFLSTGDIQYANQPAPVAPAIGGAYPGSDPGQYGLLANIPGLVGGPGPGGSGLIAARGLVSDATSGAIPLIGNAFDASQVVAAFVAGSADVNLLVAGNPFVGTFSAIGSANNELTGGTLISGGGIQTLTIPILVEAEININGIPVFEALSGQIVATAPVPEPSTVILAGLGGIAFLVLRRRR